MTRQAGWASAAGVSAPAGMLSVRSVSWVEAREVRFVGKASRSRRLKKDTERQRRRAAQAAGRNSLCRAKTQA
jgi:hypothetical protein